MSPGFWLVRFLADATLAVPETSTCTMNHPNPKLGLPRTGFMDALAPDDAGSKVLGFRL